MPRPHRYWTSRFALGLGVLVLSGNGAPSSLIALFAGKGNYVAVDVLCGLFGFWFALAAITPLVRLLGEDVRLRRDWGRDVHDAFARATTPRQVFLLLLAVAEADGRAGPAEHELVRRFLLQRFLDPIDAEALRHWSAEAIRTKDLAGLARRVARGLGPAERATLYSWSCLVALADGELRPAEHEALRQVALGLGLAPEHAQLLLLLAQQLHQRSRDGRDGRTLPRPQRPATDRERALASLGLPPDATPAAIRRRHRELVRRFHPDALPQLGPVAQQEATERFREIQRAYEQLTS